MATALDILRAASDATRLRVLGLLRSMELSVGELAQVLEQSQPRVSRHIKILCDAGLTVRRKEGSWVFVALGDAAVVRPLIDALDAWAATPDPLAEADSVRLAEVRADRAAAAAAWFEAHAGEWDAIRSLHVAEEQVERAMLAALGGARIGLLVDIGRPSASTGRRKCCGWRGRS
jgi:DNA-binding transcriptional ArsR family regulator